ncbi:uncharacterized protein [Musca autumnalis]|uniref:uncharacterized protein n=1 Tax=Musca autumnalis TaxID=221902 RepID=UPI003CEA6EDD
MTSRVELDLNVEVDVLTAGTVAEVVNAILESLLYQRNQIPFVYKTYRYYVNKWADGDERYGAEVESVKNFQVQRQRQLAKTTKDSISAMREVIKETFTRIHIKSVRFLFGGTSFTPKEAYTIHIPSEDVLRNHSWEQHRIEAPKLNETLISLVTNETLYSIFSQNLCPTNIYLEFELFNHCTNSSTWQVNDSKLNIFPKEFSEAPSSCKDIQINIVHKGKPNAENKHLKCCRDMQIFEDAVSPLGNSVTALKECKESMKATSMKSTGWWESDVIIRGFKEQTIRGFNMWK